MADISKITLPSGNTYDIKDAVARAAIAGGVSFIIAWDGTSTPVVADIPAGVVVKYNNVDYTGTLSADNAVVGAFYLVKSATQIGLDVYDEYVPVGTTPKSWEKIGDTQLDLTDVVTDVSLSKQTDTVIGSDATFTITQPTIALSTGATAGSGVISVATGISSVTQPTVNLSAENSSATGRAQFVQSLNTRRIGARADGVGVDWSSKDQKTVLTGVQVTAQPTVTLSGSASGTGPTYVEAQGTATTTKIKATADITGKTGSAASSVTPTTKKLVTTTITGVSGSTNITPVESRTSQTTATGGWTAVTASSTDGNSNGNPDVNENLLANISVSNETLTIGAATLNTQTTYSAGAPRASLAVPTAAGSATRVATGSVNTTDSNGADIVTDVAVGDTITVVTAAPAITISSGSTGDITVATGIGAATTKYLSATATGTTVGAAPNGTAEVIGSNATFNVIQPSIELYKDADEGVGIEVIDGGTIKYMAATASGTAVTPTTTNVKATATGANTAWNNKDQVTVLTSATDVSVTKGNS